MKYLLRKMFRDLWDLKVQFCSVFFMALLGVLIYTGIEGVWFGMQNRGNAWFSESNLADAWVSGSSMSDQNIDSVRNLAQISEAEAATITNVKLKWEDESVKDADIQLVSTEKNTISKPTVTEGDPYDPDGDGCWLNQDFAKEHGLKSGSNITLSLNGKSQVLDVRGLILSPEYISYTGSSTSLLADHKQYGYAMVSEDTMKNFSSDSSYNQIKIVYSADTDTAKLREDIENTLGNQYVGFSDRSNFKGVSTYTDKIFQVKKLSIMFSALFLLLALLTMQTTMKRLVETERTQIGTLKALGFRNGQLLFHYALYGFVASLFGAAIGTLLAPHTITTILLKIQKEQFSVPIWQGKNSWASYAVAALVVICCTLSAFLASRRGIQGMPAETMREEVPKGGKQIVLEHFSGLWKGLPFEWKWSFRDMARNKGRTLIGIIGVLGSMMLLIASFGMYNSLANENKYLYGTQYNYAAKTILLPTATKDDLNNLFIEANKNGQWVEESNMEIRTAKNQKTAMLSILEPGNFVHLQDMKGNIAVLPNDGLIVSHKIAKEMNIQKGDTIQFRIAGSTDYCTMTVAEIVTAPSPQGIYISPKVWESLGQTFHPTALLMGGKNNLDKIKGFSYVKETTTMQEQLDDANKVLSSAIMIIVMLIVAAILLSVIILYNLGVLSYTERKREYATMKVLGFHQKEIRAAILRDNIFNIIVGWLLGVPVGFEFLNIYVSAVTTDTIEYSPTISPVYFLLATCITIGCSLCVSLIVSRKARKLDMVEALKSVE